MHTHPPTHTQVSLQIVINQSIKHIQTHIGEQAYTLRRCLLCGRPTQQLVMMENTQHSHWHPTGCPVIVTHQGPLIPQRTWGSRTWTRAIYSSAASSFQTTPPTKQRCSWFCTVGSQTIETHRPVSKHSHNPKSVHAQRHMHTAQHMLKPLSCCLLTHYSIACYFLKQEKAVYPQRSAERFATRLSPGIWEVTLKFEECGEVWNLRNTENDHLLEQRSFFPVVSKSLLQPRLYEMSTGREYYRHYWWQRRKVSVHQ